VEFQLWNNKPDFIKVSVSMGVSEVRPDDNPGSILTRADKALYASKKAGRNKVSLEDDKKFFSVI
jgi:diguanylate cyclase